jgi:baseplate J-like protein
MDSRDRISALLDPSNTTLNGIDFVEIAPADQTRLRVHFLTTVALRGTVTDVGIDGGETIPTVALAPIDDAAWSTDADGRPVLALTAAAAGDFSTYTLTLSSAALDPYFSSSKFSFKASCPSDLDCAEPPLPCPPSAGDLPPIDYLAKDFRSFRKALTDFSALRYPEWAERSEADFGMMFLEALCALADDLSYTQDRVAAEATLDTATQRRSIVRLARLVDYEPRPATSAGALLQFNVLTGSTSIPVGLVVSAQAADGTQIDFETGTGLADDRAAYAVNSAWNGARDGGDGIQPYTWDDSQLCLSTGVTEMWVVGHGFGFTKGQQLLIDTPGATPADPPNRQVVTLAADPVQEEDALFPTGGSPTKVTHLRWRTEDALVAEHDLTRTTLAGNLVPATQGKRFSERFAIGTPPAAVPGMPVAVVRTGSGSTWDAPVPEYLYTLRNGRLAWLGGDDPAIAPLPELRLSQPPVPPQSTPMPWTWRRRLLDADPFERAVTIDPAAWRPVTRHLGGPVVFDYDGDDGDTLRFGDGVFGEIPVDGAVFEVVYRVGVGATGNVAADSITRVDPTAGMSVLSVTNPFAASGGRSAEPDEQVRRLAPQAFRARQFRAVRRTDYQDAAQTLPWVSRAGTAYRWTGSWLTVFTTADPKGTEILAPDRHTELVHLLNRYRLAGYESYVPAPLFASLDLIVTVCAHSDVFRGDVEAAVLAALSTGQLPDGRTGFFHPDRFTFGTPLERSALEAAVQDAVGVAGVLSVQFRPRGMSGFQSLPDTVPVASDRLLRVDSDRSRPEAGSVRVVVEGGK